MGVELIIILLGLIFGGFCIGYPIGHYAARRDAMRRLFAESKPSRRRPDYTVNHYGVLNDDVLEVRK